MQRAAISRENLLEDVGQVSALVAHVHLPSGQRLHQALGLVAQSGDEDEVHFHVGVLLL